MKVIVNGANGKMGTESVKAIQLESDLELVGTADQGDDLTALIQETNAEVVLDFTTPDAVKDNTLAILNAGARALVGTTGLSEQDMKAIHALAEEKQLSAFIVPNFAIGAVLMMKFAAEAAKYMPSAEIIEYHHDQKIDAPSGTAIKTAEMMTAANSSINHQEAIDSKDILPGARGAEKGGVPIHAIRLRGFVASQEVIFGGQGQTLRIVHDTINRESFMPGVVLAIRQMNSFTGCRYGLDTIL